jgi:thiamine-phosphate pyrophosphorylase
MQRLARAARGGAGRRKILDRALPPLVLVTDQARLADPLTAARAMPSGSAILLRHYDAPNRHALALALAKECHDRGLRLWVAGDLALARSVRADGLHLPQRMVRGFRPPVTKSMIVTASAHSVSAIRRAEKMGVDAVLVSPVFPSKSHPDQAPLGPSRFRRWVGQAGVPVYGLGGIGPGNAGQLAQSGTAGFAAIGALSQHGR